MCEDERIRPTVALVDLEAVRHNCRVLRGLLRAGARHLAVVKADGYGHGAVPVARACLDAGVDMLGVALVEEGIELRRAGIAGPVLVLSEPPAGAAGHVVASRLTSTVWSRAAAEALSEAAVEARAVTGVHLAVDTGMHREGAHPDAAVGILRDAAALPGVRVEGVWTHFACADDPGHPANAAQLARFVALLAELEREGLRPPIAHAANSAATIADPATHLDMVRTGIAVYGLVPSPVLEGRVDLRAAMQVSSRAVQVRRVLAGEGIGYGLTYAPGRHSDVAVVPIGYADGVARLLSNAGEVLVRGVRRPVAGRVSMDQIVVDCGPGGVSVDDEVVILGSQGDDEITADEIAAKIGTINYEVVSSIGPRVPRVYRG